MAHCAACCTYTSCMTYLFYRHQVIQVILLVNSYSAASAETLQQSIRSFLHSTDICTNTAVTSARAVLCCSQMSTAGSRLKQQNSNASDLGPERHHSYLGQDVEDSDLMHVAMSGACM